MRRITVNSDGSTFSPRPASTRDDILAAGEQVFAELGFDGASLDDIAARVGIRRPSVLHHFRSKREIYDAVERAIFDQLNASIDAVDLPADHFDQLMALLGGWLTFMADRPTAARIILRNASDLTARSLDPVEFSNRAVNRFEEIIEAGVKAGAFRPVHPMMALNVLGSAVLSFVCNAKQLGVEREYDATALAVRAEFLEVLRASARGLLLGA